MTRLFRMIRISRMTGFFAVATTFTLLLASCRNDEKIPDVSGVPVNDIHIERFDRAFFALDSNNVLPGLYKLRQGFPYFTDDFIANILGAGPLSDTNRLAIQAARQFLVSYLPVRDSLERKFADMSGVEKELTKGFRFFRYYFPGYSLPRKVVASIGPFDGPGVALTSYALAIGLQLYAGRNFSFYLSPKGMDMYPPYISRRFEPAYITTGCLRALAEDVFPDQSEGSPLIDQMVTKGKYGWLADKLQPETPDSIKTGYTQAQLSWCKANEGSIWDFFLRGTDLYTVDPDIIKNYIGDGPYTQGMPEASPGNIGAWVGKQIVRKYVADHGDISPEILMKTPARKIFEESKYKPK